MESLSIVKLNKLCDNQVKIMVEYINRITIIRMDVDNVMAENSHFWEFSKGLNIISKPLNWTAPYAVLISSIKVTQQYI